MTSLSQTQTFVLHARLLLASPAVVDGDGVIHDGIFAASAPPPGGSTGESESEDDEDGFACNECARGTPHRMGFVSVPSGALKVTVGPHLVTGVTVLAAPAGPVFSLSVGDGHGGKFQVVGSEYELALWGPGGQVIHAERGTFERL
jgi:hypothetical protein